MLLRALVPPTFLVLAGFAAPCAAVTNPTASEPGLVGTWQLIRMENTAGDGKVTYPFGEHPLGHIQRR
jgi:lipocalin-like protein